ncbi:hypothetical protein BOTNAR_0258g00060 [Botryotinia narcissicola]|uniref:Uncharacterized protein n=1 Tax=Botryotinia narcissicola TaxID=278944 RepID=A0A4Z1IDI5_9HELO|nr:hypothetical protein BOTNAR_0258g00060 [Botryotinia narcissicola]
MLRSATLREEVMRLFLKHTEFFLVKNHQAFISYLPSFLITLTSAMVSSQVSLGQSEESKGKMIAEWAQEWESEVVELANTNGNGWSERDWSERDWSELGENLMRTLAKAIDPIL